MFVLRGRDSDVSGDFLAFYQGGVERIFNVEDPIFTPKGPLRLKETIFILNRTLKNETHKFLSKTDLI